MSNRFDRKIEEIMHALRDAGFLMKGIRNGLRVKMNKGMDVDIYTLKSDADHIRARIRTHVDNEILRGEILADITGQLQQGLSDLAELEEFRLTRQENGVFTYYSRIFWGSGDILILEELTPSQIKIAPRETQPPCRADGNDLDNAMTLLETVDPRSFRKALDDLGLARSSLLRLILTRLFRAAVDPEEFETAIRQEAERITDPQDRMALEQIRAFNVIDFLDPLVNLLHGQVADHPES